MNKRLTALFLCLVMVLTMLPVTVLAEPKADADTASESVTESEIVEVTPAEAGAEDDEPAADAAPEVDADPAPIKEAPAEEIAPDALDESLTRVPGDGENRQTGLYMRWMDWDEKSNQFVLPQNANMDGGAYGAPGDDWAIQFVYYDNAQSSVTVLGINDLRSYDSKLISISADEEQPDVVTRLEFKDFGETDIKYTAANGNVYTFHVEIGLPDVGIYKANQATQANYITELDYTGPDTAVYLLARDNTIAIKRVYPEHDGFSVATDPEAVASDDGIEAGVQSVKVTFSHMNTRDVNLRVIFRREGDDHNEDWNRHIRVNNRVSGLYFLDTDWDNEKDMEVPRNEDDPELHNFLFQAPGDERGMALVYVTFDAEGDRSIKTLVPGDVRTDNGNLTLSGDRHPQITRLAVGNQFTGGNIVYTVDGKEYKLPVEVGLPDVGFYKAAQVSEQNFVSTWQYTGADDVLYLMPLNDDIRITGVRSNDYDDDELFLTPVYVDSDKNKPIAYYEVSLLQPRNEWLPMEVSVQYRENNGWRDDNRWFQVKIRDQRTGLFIRDFYWDEQGMHPEEGNTCYNVWWDAPQCCTYEVLYRAQATDDWTVVSWNQLEVTKGQDLVNLFNDSNNNVTGVGMEFTGVGDVTFAYKQDKDATMTAHLVRPGNGLYTIGEYGDDGHMDSHLIASTWNYDGENGDLYVLFHDAEWRTGQKYLRAEFLDGSSRFSSQIILNGRGIKLHLEELQGNDPRLRVRIYIDVNSDGQFDWEDGDYDKEFDVSIHAPAHYETGLVYIKGMNEAFGDGDTLVVCRGDVLYTGVTDKDYPGYVVGWGSDDIQNMRDHGIGVTGYPVDWDDALIGPKLDFTNAQPGEYTLPFYFVEDKPEYVVWNNQQHTTGCYFTEAGYANRKHEILLHIEVREPIETVVVKDDVVTYQNGETICVPQGQNLVLWAVTDMNLIGDYVMVGWCPEDYAKNDKGGPLIGQDGYMTSEDGKFRVQTFEAMTDKDNSFTGLADIGYKGPIVDTSQMEVGKEYTLLWTYNRGSDVEQNGWDGAVPISELRIKIKVVAKNDALTVSPQPDQGRIFHTVNVDPASAGDTVTLQVEATPAAGLTYQWRECRWGGMAIGHYNVPMKNGTSATLTVPKMTSEYICVVSDANGYRKSVYFQVNVDNWLSVEYTGPEYIAIFPGDSLTIDGKNFQIDAKDKSQLEFSWQWRRSYGHYGEAWGETEAKPLSRNNGSVGFTDNGEDGDGIRCMYSEYRCVVSDQYGNWVETEPIYVLPSFINPTGQAAKNITGWDENEDYMGISMYYVAKDTPVTLGVEANPYLNAEHGYNVTYQWYENKFDLNRQDPHYREKLDGETNATLSLGNMTGERDLVCVANDGQDHECAWRFIVGIENHLSLTTDKTTVFVPKGGDVVLTVNATQDGNGPLQYAWYDAEGPIDNASTNMLHLTNVTKDCEINAAVKDEFGGLVFLNDEMGDVIRVVVGDVMNVTSQAELTAALTAEAPVAEIHITKSFTVTQESFIPHDDAAGHVRNYRDTQLFIDQGVTLTVGSGGIFGNNVFSYNGDAHGWNNAPTAQIISNGKVIIASGGATEASFEVNKGTIQIQSGGSGVVVGYNAGTVTVESGAEYRTAQGGTPVNEGTLTVAKGAEMEARMGATFINKGTMTLNGIFIANCVRYDNTDHVWFENTGTVLGGGAIYLNDVVDEDSQFPAIADMTALLTRVRNGIAGDNTIIVSIKPIAWGEGWILDYKGSLTVENKAALADFRAKTNAEEKAKTVAVYLSEDVTRADVVLTGCSNVKDLYIPAYKSDAKWSGFSLTGTELHFWQDLAATVVLPDSVKQEDKAVEVKLLDETGNEVKIQEATVETSGSKENVAIKGVADGAYKMEVAQEGCVTRKVSVEIKDGDLKIDVDVKLVKKGNLNGSEGVGNEVDVTDMACLFDYLAQGLRTGELVADNVAQQTDDEKEYFDTVANVNGDDVVNILDYQALYEMVKPN